MVIENLSETTLLLPNSIIWILTVTLGFTLSADAKYLMDVRRFPSIHPDASHQAIKHQESNHEGTVMKKQAKKS